MRQAETSWEIHSVSVPPHGKPHDTDRRACLENYYSLPSLRKQAPVPLFRLWDADRLPQDVSSAAIWASGLLCLLAYPLCGRWYP